MELEILKKVYIDVYRTSTQTWSNDYHLFNELRLFIADLIIESKSSNTTKLLEITKETQSLLDFLIERYGVSSRNYGWSDTFIDNLELLFTELNLINKNFIRKVY